MHFCSYICVIVCRIEEKEIGVLYEMIHAVWCMYSVWYFVQCCHCCGGAVQQLYSRDLTVLL